MWSFPRTAKDWLAEKIANNLISSRLKATESDDEAEDEELRPDRFSPKRARFSLAKGRMNGRMPGIRPAIKAVQAIEKARLNTTSDSFQSMLFSKFVTSSKLDRIVEQYCDDQPTTASKAVQTDPIRKHLLASPELELTLLDVEPKFHLEDSKASAAEGVVARQLYESSSTFEVGDAESVISTAYYDVEFDGAYATAHSSVDRISQMLKRSQCSLEANVEVDMNT
ncbi:unnamed protein product [Toxocara canis]|uniref:Condensin complex subunit 2 n=1 Tax=Toxocara canis TaxID=6265 RepID=A0A183TZR2_TOXCA|nr:unnamed protein product [Toxocara canis]